VVFPVENLDRIIVKDIEGSKGQFTHGSSSTQLDHQFHLGYWQVGEYISLKIESDGWGKGTIQNLGTYIQKAQPGIRGFSSQNIWRMRQFYQAYKEQPILSAVLRELPWTHHMLILGRAKMEEEREFYVRLEHDKALKRVITALFKDDAQLFKQFQDNESFRGWLTDTVFGMTYEEQGGVAGGFSGHHQDSIQAIT